MRTGRPKSTLTMSSDERTHLLAITRSRSLPAALTLRAKIVLACEREPSNAVVATRLGVGPHTIGKWRNRFITDRIEGLYDEMRSGRPRTVEDEAVAELITKTLARKPKAATHWSVRAIAKETGIAKSTVHRLFQLFGLQPHRTRSFKLSTDPFFVEKLRDVVGLYLNPPDKAVVLCVDEKSQIQALERTQPMLPMGFGYIEGVTHDYQRHGTTTLFAALNVLDGAVIPQCKPRHRHQEFLAFLRHIETNVPAQLDIHLVVDNYATHKHPKVRAWLARRPNFRDRTPVMNSQATSLTAWMRHRSEIAARLVYLREISGTAFWEFCNSIRGKPEVIGRRSKRRFWPRLGHGVSALLCHSNEKATAFNFIGEQC